MMYKLISGIILIFIAIIFTGGIYAYYDEYQLTKKVCENKYKDKDGYDYCMTKQHVIVDAQQDYGS